MRDGQVVRLRRWTHYSSDGKSSFLFQAPPGRVVLMVSLGNDPLRPEGTEEQLNPFEALEALGWRREQDVERLRAACRAALEWAKSDAATIPELAEEVVPQLEAALEVS